MGLRKRALEIYDLAIVWLKVRIRSPVSNWLSKAAFIVGAMVVSTPLFEHLLFTAILKQIVGIDLGINVPDVQAYVAGCFLMTAAMAHNLVFVKLNQQHAENQRSAKVSIYKELWVLLDGMFDSTARLVHLYCTELADRDATLVLEAENAIVRLQSHARKNRPFYFSEELYEKAVGLSRDCISHTESFRACMGMKKSNTLNYNFSMAQKAIDQELSEMSARYNEICEEIRTYVDAI